MRWPSARELVLFAHALRLSLAAQRVSRAGAGEVAAHLAAVALLPRGVAPEEARLAAVRAGARVARYLGRLDSCLTRSLVVAALLADRDGVALHVGFRPAAEPAAREAPPDGHAWVTVAGEAATPADVEPGHAGPFAEVLRIPVRRPAR